MSVSEKNHKDVVDSLSKASESTGRQDLIAPPPTTEKSDPLPVDMKRGQHVWVGFALLGVLFVAIIVYFAMTS